MKQKAIQNLLEKIAQQAILQRCTVPHSKVEKCEDAMLLSFLKWRKVSFLPLITYKDQGKHSKAYEAVRIHEQALLLRLQTQCPPFYNKWEEYPDLW